MSSPHDPAEVEKQNVIQSIRDYGIDDSGGTTDATDPTGSPAPPAGPYSPPDSPDVMDPLGTVGKRPEVDDHNSEWLNDRRA